jgi:transposase
VPPEQLRQVVVCKPTHCRGCGHDLHGEDAEPLRHQVAELPPVLPEVDEYQLHRLACPRCGKRTCAALPPGVPTGAFGPRLRAVLSVLVGAYRLGKRPAQQLVFDLLGLSISLGMIARLERQGATVLEAPVEELRQHVRDAVSAHIDETSWWQGRAKAWLWTAVTDLVTVFTIATSRGADVAKEMLGTAADKVVISDRLKSYSWVKRRQFCWAHLDRDFQAMVDRGGRIGRGWSAVVGPLRAALRLVAPGAGRDDGPIHLAVESRHHAVLVPGRPAPWADLWSFQDSGDVPGVAGR